MLSALERLPYRAHHPPPMASLDAHLRLDMIIKVDRRRLGTSPWMDLGGEHIVVLLAPVEGHIDLEAADGRTWTCHPGSLMLIPRPFDGRYRNCAVAGRFRNCWARISGSAAFDLAAAVQELHGPLVDLAQVPLAEHAVGALFTRALAEQPADAATLAGLTAQALVHLAAPAAPSREIDRILGLIEAELGNPDLGVTRLAQAAGCAESTFSRRFQDAIGTSPYRYILQRRIDRARAELLGEDSIAAIGQRCGYRDAAHFVHSFRRSMGTSPGRYRRQMQQQGG